MVTDVTIYKCNHTQFAYIVDKQIFNNVFSYKFFMKLFRLINLYSELAACGVMDGKRKDSLKTEIMNLINEQ